MKALDYSAAEYVGDQIHTAETIEAAGTRRIHRKVDAVIVGSGPGGLCAAHVLSGAGLSVLVVEAGQFWEPGSFKREQSWATEHLYQERGTRIAKGNSIIPVASGKGVGGGTLINSGISFRAPDRILDEWQREFGTDFWAEDRREALYEEVERAINVAPTSPAVAGGNTRVAKRGFEALGVEAHFMPRNTPGCAGCGTCQTGCPTGGKASADLNWLPSTLRNGGVVYSDTRAEEILMEGDRAVGIRGITRDPNTDEEIAELEVLADRVVLAGGAIHTPMMLQRQGLAADNDHLGANLHIHPGISVLAHMNEEVLIWQGATQGYYAHHPDDTDIIAETFSAPPEALFTPGAEVGHEGVRFLQRLRELAGCGVMIRDDSAGTVEPGRNPWKANISYSVNEADRRKLLKGYSFVIDMFFAAGADEVKPLVNGAQFFNSIHRAKDAVLQSESPGEMTIYASHPLGTCRMSPDPDRGVIRPTDGQVHGIENLHITDASTFPNSPGVNPQLTIMGTSLALARGIVAAA